MKNFFFLTRILVVYLFLFSAGISKESKYLEQGLKLYEKKEFSKSKIFFEKDLVFDPKSEKSYLYLAKIFKKNNNEEEEEVNLNTVLLLNPQNDEAIYMLILLKIKQSDYNETQKLIDQFTLVCKTFCSKKSEIQDKFKKLATENEQTKN